MKLLVTSWDPCRRSHRYDLVMSRHRSLAVGRLIELTRVVLVSEPEPVPELLLYGAECCGKRLILGAVIDKILYTLVGCSAELS